MKPYFKKSLARYGYFVKDNFEEWYIIKQVKFNISYALLYLIAAVLLVFVGIYYFLINKNDQGVGFLISALIPLTTHFSYKKWWKTKLRYKKEFIKLTQEYIIIHKNDISIQVLIKDIKSLSIEIENIVEQLIYKETNYQGYINILSHTGQIIALICFKNERKGTLKDDLELAKKNFESFIQNVQSKKVQQN